jgi:hypothetical protein
MALSTQEKRLALLMARGMSNDEAAAKLTPPVEGRTARRWRANNSAIDGERDRIQQESDPEAYQVLTDAMLTARRDDGVDWSSRVAAARARIAMNVAAQGDPHQTVVIIDRRTQPGDGEVLYGDEPEPVPAATSSGEVAVDDEPEPLRLILPD